MATRNGDMPVIKFGDKVLVAKRLKRRTSWTKPSEPNKYTDVKYKHWVEYPMIKQKECLFIGFRTLANGVADYIGDGATVFLPRDYVKVALVVTDGNTNPFYAPLNALLAVELDRDGGDAERIERESKAGNRLVSAIKQYVDETKWVIPQPPKGE